MVDVGPKAVTKRYARAGCIIVLGPELLCQLKEKGFQNKKGSILNTAILAGIMAAKQTSSLIPLCHPLPLDKCNVTIEPESDHSLKVECECSTSSRTGVEMEALTGASVAALTVYDMCKAVDREMVVGQVRLVAKRGGKSGDFVRSDEPGGSVRG